MKVEVNVVVAKLWVVDGNYVSLMVVRFNDSESLGTDVGDCRVAFATEDFV